MLALAVVVAVGLNASACSGLATAPGDAPGIITPTEVLANPESFVGKQIRVSGRIHVEKYETAGPCNPATGEGCITPAYTSLHIVTSDESRRDTNSLDLYHSAGQGALEPLRCRVVGNNQFDCGPYAEDATATVSGRVVKHRIPIQQVGYPNGRVEVIRYREIYILLIQP